MRTKRNRRVEKLRSESRVTETFFLKTCGLKETKLFILMLDESTEYMQQKSFPHTLKHQSLFNLMFSTCKSVNDNFNKRSFSHGTVCNNKFKYLLGDPLSRTPFLEKGPPKITEGSRFDPHWSISRINPATFITIIPTHFLCQMQANSP